MADQSFCMLPQALLHVDLHVLLVDKRIDSVDSISFSLTYDSFSGHNRYLESHNLERTIGKW